MTNAAAKKTTTPKAPAKKAPAKRTAKKATTTNPLTSDLTAEDFGAKKAPVKKVAAKKATTSDKPKKEQTFEERDWSYLGDKEPSEQHVLLAKEINRRTEATADCGECETEVPISAKQVQAVLAMFPHFQRSATNKSRSGYVPLAAEIVHQRSVHMTQAHADARLIMDSLANATGTAKKVAKATPTAKKTAPAKPVAAKATPAPAKKAPASQAHAAKKAVAKKARVTKRTPAIPAPASEAF